MRSFHSSRLLLGAGLLLFASCDSKKSVSGPVVPNEPPAPPPPVAVGSIYVDRSLIVLQRGESFQLAAVVRSIDGALLTGRPVEWASGNADVATVSGTGQVRALTLGTTMITATCEDATATITVNVLQIEERPNSLEIGTLGFTSARTGTAQLFTVGTSGVQQVKPNPDQDFLDGWSPDGSRLLFHRRDAGEPYNANRRFWTVNADGTGELQLTTPGWWVAPDFTKLAAIGPGVITVAGLDGSDARLLHLPVQSTSFPPYPWSPDGTRLAFIAVAGTALDLYVINADGSGATNLANSARINPQFVSWSADSRRLAVVDRDGSLYSVNADGTGSSFLAQGGNALVGHAALPRWSPDGQWIAYQFVEGSATALVRDIIHLIRPNGSDHRQLTPVGLYAAEGDGGPEWSPDGQWIAFAATRSNVFGARGLSGLYVVNVDGTRLIQISSHDEDWRPRWKP
jgi:dipeptidyl aminopeptidase/acylaminoacyl peptidase